MKNRLPEASGGRFLCCMVRMLLPAQFCVGGDAYIAPLGTIEFAEDFRKIGITCRVDVGIDPYEHPGSARELVGADRVVRPYEAVRIDTAKSVHVLDDLI